MNKEISRKQIIVRTSIGGVIANVLLGLFKIGFGFIAGSAAVISDAVSNFSDAVASVVIVIGTIFSDRKPDRKHPYGYGRIEYMITLILSMIVLFAGAEVMVEAFEVFEHPHELHYTWQTLTVIIISIIVKVIYGKYTQKRAHAAESKALHASGSEAVHHALISLLTLGSAVLDMFTGYRFDAFTTGAIGIFIIYEGIHLLKSALSEILGEKHSGDLAKTIKATICSFEPVSGAYDLYLHDYGPDRMLGSVHIEVPDTLTLPELDMLERKIVNKVRIEHQVILTAVSIYCKNTHNDASAALRDEMKDFVMSHDNVTGFHGFYVNPESGYVSFDIVINFKEKDRSDLFHQIRQELEKKYPQYDFHLTMDIDLS